MEREKVLNEIIEGYRKSISQRYQYQNINSKYEIPDSINEEMVNSIRSYFLNYVYPDSKKRDELNEAFKSLDNYTRHPEKLIRILVDSARLLFSHGRHLPKILKSGLKAMNTFKAATNFENKLVDAAIKYKIEPPYNLSKINTLIKSLSRKEILHFIDSSISLFEILHDQHLIEKIREVIQTIIDIMRKKQKSYSINEIRGLEIGLEMLNEGNSLFNQLTTEDQKIFVPFIVNIEQDTLDHIFSGK